MTKKAKRSKTSSSGPYKQWLKARKVTENSTEYVESLQIQISALKSILSDMDEHDDANIWEYGAGKYSQDDFEKFLKQTKLTLKNLEKPASIPSAKHTLKQKTPILKLSSPIEFPGSNGPMPAFTVNQYFSTDGEVGCLRSLKEGKIVKKFTFSSKDIKRVAISIDGKYLAVGFTMGKLLCLDLKTGSKLFESTAQNGWVTSLAFSWDGRYLVSGGEEDKVIVQELPSGKVVAETKISDDSSEIGQFCNLAVSTDGKKILYTQEGQLVVRNITTLKEIVRLDEIEGAELACIADYLIFLPYNRIAIMNLSQEEILEESPLLEKDTRWASGRYLTIHHERSLAAILLVEEAKAGSKTCELQIWNLFPLKRLIQEPLPGFQVCKPDSLGGLAFTRDSILLVGENLTLYFKVYFQT